MIHALDGNGKFFFCNNAKGWLIWKKESIFEKEKKEKTKVPKSKKSLDEERKTQISQKNLLENESLSSFGISKKNRICQSKKAGNLLKSYLSKRKILSSNSKMKKMWPERMLHSKIMTQKKELQSMEWETKQICKRI